jgi:hypothetical protein
VYGITWIPSAHRSESSKERRVSRRPEGDSTSNGKDELRSALGWINHKGDRTHLEALFGHFT